MKHRIYKVVPSLIRKQSTRKLSDDQLKILVLSEITKKPHNMAQLKGVAVMHGVTFGRVWDVVEALYNQRRIEYFFCPEAISATLTYRVKK